MPDDVSRVTISSPEQAAAAKQAARQYDARNTTDGQPASARFNATATAVGQPLSVTIGNGAQITTPGFSRVTTSDIVASQDNSATGRSGGILSTARSAKSGAPVSGGDVRPETIVRVKGMETTAVAAEKMGLLRRNSTTGFYEEVGAPTPNNTATNQERLEGEYQQAKDDQRAAEEQEARAKAEADAEQIEPFSDELEGHISEFQKVGNMDFAAGMGEMIAQGELTDHTVDSLASQMGLSGDEVRTRAEGLRAAFETQAKAISGAGDALPGILQFMHERDPEVVNKAIRDHVEQGKRNAYDGVVQAFIYDLDRINPDLILNSPDAEARGVRREKDGSITVDVPNGGRMPWKVAVKLGRIKPGVR